MIELTYKRNATQKNWIIEYFPSHHAIPYQEIALLEKQIDKALEERKEEKFKELSKKYALLKADYV